MSTNYGDYIAWDKGYGYQISKITKVMNLNRHMHLGSDELIFIDNNSYELNEVVQLIDKGKAVLFYEEDVTYNTDSIEDVNKVLLIDKSVYGVYGEWVGLLMSMCNKSVEAANNDIDYCEDIDSKASELTGINKGYYVGKDIQNDTYAETFMKCWKKHLGI